MTEIVWLLEETILAIHYRQIAEHGGSDGLRDEGLLSSALARPQNLLAYGEPSPDLAALAAGGWNSEEKKALAKAYYAALAPGDGWAPSLEELLTVLDYCRLHLAVQWLGWASGWSPPPKHTQDWLGEALALAKKLQLM